MATKVLDVDLPNDLRDLTGLDGYSRAWILLRWRGRVIGQVRHDVDGDRISALDLWRACHATLGWSFHPYLTEELVRSRDPFPEREAELLSPSVIVCTRDRPEDLRRCLDSICSFSPPDTEILVVDNAPSDTRTARLTSDYPVRYVREERRGLNWARTRGAEEALGGIVAFIDDDASAGDGWLAALLAPFTDPEVAAVTGLVMPMELESTAQEEFELYCGFNRGFIRKEFTARTVSPLAAANVGAGACMAIRRHLVNHLGLFRSEMDCGTETRSGGDTYAFYRLLSLGYRIVYTPDAVVWHRHRRTVRELRDTLYGYSVGTYAFLLRALLEHREIGAINLSFRWFFQHHLRRLWRRLKGEADAPPLSITLAEVRGVLAAPQAYLSSRRAERMKAGGFRQTAMIQHSGVLDACAEYRHPHP
jgi:GT2 family glycosyltransferase